MIKTKTFRVLLLVAAFTSLRFSDGVLITPPAAANGVIVTEPENAPPKKPAPKKAAPKKKPPVKKPAPLPPAPPPKPPTPTAFEKALALLEMRYFTKATALLEEIATKDPLNPGVWFALGNAYKARGFFPKAQMAYKKALEIDPSFRDLSRILEYPSSGERQPLWDPRRPGRIEEIPLAADGFRVLPPVEVDRPQLKEPSSPPPTPPQPAEAKGPSPKKPPMKRALPPPGSNSISPILGVPVRVVGPTSSTTTDSDSADGAPLKTTMPPGGDEKPPEGFNPNSLPVYIPPTPPGQDGPVYVPPPPPSEEQP